jgi:hypothetical protein
MRLCEMGRYRDRYGLGGLRRGLGACLPSYPNKFSDMTEMEIVTRGAPRCASKVVTGIRL